MDLLSRTLIARPDIRSLIRHLSVSSLDPFFGVTPPTLYVWLPLLPHNTIISLYLCTGAEEPFLSQLLRSPMLHSIQHLGLAASEPCFIGRNLMSKLLASAPNVSQIAINLPRSSTALMFPSDLYAHFTPLSCCIRHIIVSMGAFTPLFTDLLRAAQVHSKVSTVKCLIISTRIFDTHWTLALPLFIPCMYIPKACFLTLCF